MNPETWGWKGIFHGFWQSACQEDGRKYIPGRIIRREYHQYDVVVPHYIDENLMLASACTAGLYRNIRVSGAFAFRTTGGADYPVTGDWVLLDPEEDGLRIHRVLPRQTALSRGAAGDKTEEQVLAANIDTLLLVFALDGGRNFLRTFLERALVVARSAGCGVCIVLNKADLADAETRRNALATAALAAPGSPVVAVSAKTGEGLEELSRYFSAGETLGVLGKSGVGKSALIGALGSVTGAPLAAAPLAGTSLAGTPLAAAPLGGDSAIISSMEELPWGTPEAGLGCTGPLDEEAAPREGAVRESDRKGRHTTTSSRLYRLSSGLLIIDSPGIRELKLWADGDDLAASFSDIACLADQCRFSDCSHEGEPGCAVQAALASGELDEGRYRSYLQLKREQAWLDRRLDDQALRAEKARWKQISKFAKSLQKSRR
ncbi:GTPase RsgA [Treponema sp. J25]|uniref:GTPase RsgA n=1 Tax=Treponema sp. J25 TaxID=2094121 RepID=UPI0014043647|nr:GTPase RsgA [Treponema sp. J25]